MITQSIDTDPAIEARLIEAYRSRTPREKLIAVREGNRAVQRLQEADVRRRYPNADEYEVRMRVASRWLGPELMNRAFGWDVEAKGY